MVQSPELMIRINGLELIPSDKELAVKSLRSYCEKLMTYNLWNLCVEPRAYGLEPTKIYGLDFDR